MEAISQIDSGSNAVYRFYNTQSGKHFYTASAQEAARVATDLDIFAFEAGAFGAANEPSASNGYRFYNASTGAHFYTISEEEKDAVIANLPAFQFEGAAYQAYTGPGAGHEELYRFYNLHGETPSWTMDIASTCWGIT